MYLSSPSLSLYNVYMLHTHVRSITLSQSSLALALALPFSLSYLFLAPLPPFSLSHLLTHPLALSLFLRPSLLLPLLSPSPVYLPLSAAHETHPRLDGATVRKYYSWCVLFFFFILIILLFPYQVWESDLILGSEKISSDWTLSQHAALKQQDFAAVKYSSKMLEVINSGCLNMFDFLCVT